MINNLYYTENHKQFQYAPNCQKDNRNNDVRIVEINKVGNVSYDNPQKPNNKKRPPIFFPQFNVRISQFFHTNFLMLPFPKQV